MVFTDNRQAGIAHLVLVIAATVGILALLGVVGYSSLTNKDEKTSKEASAKGAYSSICNTVAKQKGMKAGFKLRTIKSGKGFKLYNYKNPKSGKGCALVINNNWGSRAKMSVSAQKNVYSKKFGGTAANTLAKQGPRYYKYYAGPIFYKHKKGIYLHGSKNGRTVTHRITHN